MRIQVKDIMAAPVKSTVATSPASYIRELMERKNVHAIPIVEVVSDDNIQIKGIVTATDLRGLTDESVEVQEIMSKRVHVVTPHTSVQSAARMMLKHKVHHLVAMENGVIVGMLSALDFVTLVAQHELESLT